VWEGFTVRPEVMDKNLFGTYTILTYDALNTTTDTQLEEWVKLAPEYDPANWKLTVDTANKCVKLRYFQRATLFLLK